MASPGFPTILSAEPWHLYPLSGTAFDFWFDVPAGWTIDRPEEVREARDPCGGPTTLLTTTSSVQPRRFRVPIRLNVRDNRDTRMALLETLVAGRGPYKLDAPAVSSGTLSVLLVPEQGGISWQLSSGARTALITFVATT